MRHVQAMIAMLATAGLVALLPSVTTAQGPTEHAMKRADGLEVTLLSALPLSPGELQQMMPGMRGMGGMPGMGSMMPGMSGMEGMGGGAPQPTHWLGVIVRDVSSDRVVPHLDVSLTARKGEVVRTVKLMPMPGSYGANISLPERGRYSVVITVLRSGQPVVAVFEFDYK